jgi:hypothetical protein
MSRWTVFCETSHSAENVRQLGNLPDRISRSNSINLPNCDLVLSIFIASNHTHSDGQGESVKKGMVTDALCPSARHNIDATNNNGRRKDMLTYEQLQTVIAPMKLQFGKIRKKYRKLQAYLVLCRNYHQTDIDASPQQILQELPDLIAGGEIKDSSIKIYWRVVSLQKEDDRQRLPDIVKLQKQLEEFYPHFRYHTDATVELRFKTLKYCHVWRLQRDRLVDRELTPRSKASIRIVLGNLPHLADVQKMD